MDYIKAERQIDFTGCCPAMIERRLAQRFSAVNCRDASGYLDILKRRPPEVDRLINCLTINTSRFFRNPLVFEYLNQCLLPRLLNEKKKKFEKSLRIWSTGCATGEEPYSLAIVVCELIGKKNQYVSPEIFGTDIDEKALKKAAAGIYPAESLKNVKWGLLEHYFTRVSKPAAAGHETGTQSFQLAPEIRHMVNFSCYDILAPGSTAPPESIYGGFDLILCRNVLIYFNHPQQKKIMEKLFQTLTRGGYLILGEAETPAPALHQHLKQENALCHIYRKQ